MRLIALLCFYLSRISRRLKYIMAELQALKDQVAALVAAIADFKNSHTGDSAALQAQIDQLTADKAALQAQAAADAASVAEITAQLKAATDGLKDGGTP